VVIWKRKLYRVLVGSLFPGIYLLVQDVTLPLFFSSFFLTLSLALEYERYAHPTVWSYLLNRFSVFKRASRSLLGESYFMIACFFTILVFPRAIAIAALFFLTWGDAGSAMVGTTWGKHSFFPGKTVEGFLGALACNGLAAAGLQLFLPLHPLSLITGFLLAAILESLPINLDDNLTVGFLSAAAMAIVERFC